MPQINNKVNKGTHSFNMPEIDFNTKTNTNIEYIDPKESKSRPYLAYENTGKMETEIMNVSIEPDINNQIEERRLASEVVNFVNKEHNLIINKIDELSKEIKPVDNELQYLELYTSNDSTSSSYRLKEGIKNAYISFGLSYNAVEYSQRRFYTDSYTGITYDFELYKAYITKWNKEWRNDITQKLVYGDTAVTYNQKLKTYLESLSDGEFNIYVSNNNIKPSMYEYIENKTNTIKRQKNDIEEAISLQQIIDNLLISQTYVTYMNNLRSKADFDENTRDPLEGIDIGLLFRVLPPDTPESDILKAQEHEAYYKLTLRCYGVATDEEKDIIHYIYNTQGIEELEAFINNYFTDDMINQREGMQEANKFIESIMPFKISDYNYVNEILNKEDFEEKNYNPVTKMEEADREFWDNYSEEDGPLPSDASKRDYIDKHPEIMENDMQAAFNFFNSDVYIYASDKEKKVMNYIYNTEGLDKVKSIFVATGVSNIEMLIKTHFEGTLDGLGNFSEGMINLLGGMDGIKSPHQYKEGYILAYLQKRGWLATGTYEISTSLGNMLPAIAVSVIATYCGAGGAVPEILASTFMGLSAAGNAMEDAYQNGHDKLESIIYGLFNGASEAALGYFLGGIPGISHLGKNNLTGIAKIITNMLNEGIEESTQELVDSLFRTMFLNEDFNLDIKQVAKAGLYGMITAGIMNGGQVVLTEAGGAVVDVYKILKDYKLYEALKTIDKQNIEIDYSQINDANYREKIIKIADISLEYNLKYEDASNIINAENLMDVDMSRLSDSEYKSMVIEVGKLALSTDINQIDELFSNGNIDPTMITDINNNFTEILGPDLVEWFPNDKVKFAIYMRLVQACNNANLDLSTISKSTAILSSFIEYYADAKNNLNKGKYQFTENANQFDTYRTHGIIHIFDVYTMSINTYNEFQKAGIKGMDIETVSLAALMHDTGMSGKLEMVTDENSRIKWVDMSEDGRIDAARWRAEHAANSGRIILENAGKLREFGYNDIQIAEASILAFFIQKVILE